MLQVVDLHVLSDNILLKLWGRLWTVEPVQWRTAGKGLKWVITRDQERSGLCLSQDSPLGQQPSQCAGWLVRLQSGTTDPLLTVGLPSLCRWLGSVLPASGFLCPTLFQACWPGYLPSGHWPCRLPDWLRLLGLATSIVLVDHECYWTRESQTTEIKPAVSLATHNNLVQSNFNP